MEFYKLNITTINKLIIVVKTKCVLLLISLYLVLYTMSLVDNIPSFDEMRIYFLRISYLKLGINKLNVSKTI